MNVTCLKDQFYKIITLAERHTSKEAHLPFLQGLLIHTKKNTIHVSSTNLDTGFEAWMPASVKEEGSVVLPAKSCVSLISTLTGEKIKIESKNNDVFFTTQNTSTNLKSYPVEEFPSFPKIKKIRSVEIPCENLSKSIASVVMAASSSEIKPEISSVFFNVLKNKIKMAATDSFRLAEKTIPFKGEEGFNILFPFKHVLEIGKILEHFNDPIVLSIGENQAVFSSKNYSLVTRIREEKFPNYEQIIPTTFSTEVKVKKSDFINGVRLASIFSGRLREIKFNIYPEDNLFEIFSKNSDIGEHVSQIPSNVTGERLNVTFNYSYIMDGISMISSSDVLLRFNGDSKPVLIQDPYDASYVYLAMPMKNI